MALTITPQEINDALQSINGDASACYLEFTGDIIYLHWTTDKETAQMYIDNFYECLDINLYGNWVDICGQHERGMPVALPDSKMFDCRYIIATK